MDKKNRTCIVDCACVIHGDLYNWQYVEKLHSMIQRNLNADIRFHVYTESDRQVPDHMIKHNLENWPDANRYKKGWWYKMQLFDQEHFSGDLLYFDLDVVIVKNIDWIIKLPANRLWAVRDFKYLQNENLYQINSSIMWWNVSAFDWVWKKFKQKDIKLTMKELTGDQDYIESALSQNQRQYFPDDRVISWRWQSHHGGLNFPDRTPQLPGAGTVIPDNTSVLVFHGQPKPHELPDDVVIEQHWR